MIGSPSFVDSASRTPAPPLFAIVFRLTAMLRIGYVRTFGSRSIPAQGPVYGTGCGPSGPSACGLPAPLITFESIVTPIAPTTEIPFRRAAENLLFRTETGPAYSRPFARPV